MTRWGLRWQLTWWYSLALSLVLIAFSIAMYVTIRSYLLLRIETELVEELSELGEEVEIATSEDEFRKRFPHRFSEDAIFGFQVVRTDGTVLFSNDVLAQNRLPVPSSTSAEPVNQDIRLSDGHTARLLSRVVQTPQGPLVTHVAAPLVLVEAQLQTLWSMFVINGLIALIVSVAVGYFIAQRVMVPIHRITATAERISSENLSERVPVVNEHDDLGRLATTLNTTFDRLQRSIDGMRRFTADAAHELRTPLTVIRTEVEVAQREVESKQPNTPEPFQHVADVVLAQTSRLSNLVNQLLILSRHEAGLDHQRSEEVSLRELLLDVAEALRIVAEEKGLTLVTDQLSDQTVFGDDVSLSQLFYNLIDNAVKYTPSGGTVTVSSQGGPKEVRVSIRDNGIGIDKEHLEHLFERFYRVDGSRTNGGTGLGLAICRSIVGTHQGSIHVDSQPGAGSTFTVVLPTTVTSMNRIH